MIKFLVELKKLVLGTNSKQAFKRLLILIITIGVFTTLILNIGCGISQDGNFYFNWKPADVSLKGDL